MYLAIFLVAVEMILVGDDFWKLYWDVLPFRTWTNLFPSRYGLTQRQKQRGEEDLSHNISPVHLLHRPHERGTGTLMESLVRSWLHQQGP